ncbi:MAG: histidine kinase [Comamonadaceae bacterium]|nr:histidine kinase [Comamonadaceae bacterium]
MLRLPPRRHERGGSPRRALDRAVPHPMFRIIRYFSIASFVCIVIAATALTAGFRYIAIREIVEIGEANGVALAEAALTSVRSDLLQFLDKADQRQPGQPARTAACRRLWRTRSTTVMRVKSVARIKIYNRQGLGRACHAQGIDRRRNQAGNPGVIAALSGNVASKLVYRDSFNAFDRRTEEDNLIQTYVPIVDAEDEPARGVFEIYTDVNPMVQHTEQAQLQLIGGGALIMALLYLALLAVVRYAERIIARQQDEIREHTATLERLSASMLHYQEDEKKRIAFDLHEGVAQTLSAVKMSVESVARQQALAGKGDAAALQPMVQAVKEAINEVRAVALNLRPSSLDGLGLIPTIRWFCREFMKLHPDIVTEHAIGLAEDDVPGPLQDHRLPGPGGGLSRHRQTGRCHPPASRTCRRRRHDRPHHRIRGEPRTHRHRRRRFRSGQCPRAHASLRRIIRRRRQRVGRTHRAGKLAALTAETRGFPPESRQNFHRRAERSSGVLPPVNRSSSGPRGRSPRRRPPRPAVRRHVPGH